MKSLDTLYKKTSTGADQEWTIAVDGNVIITRWGQCGGAIQETRDTIKSGKNLGKKNATTPAQQALLEAEAQWEKKLKKGYVKSLKDARAGKVDDIIEGGINPMLAHRYDEQGHKIVWPAFAQPKLDGHRCIAVIEDGKCTLWSRTRKPITSVPHIVQELEACFSRGVSVVLDGELYNHDYRDKFEELTSLIRPEAPKHGHEAVQYHVYDVPSGKAGFWHRFESVMPFINGPSLQVVETREVESEDDLIVVFEHFLELGYEGAIVRNANAPYENKRSYGLQKVKEFVDDEFVVVDVEEGRGKLSGHAIFVCAAKNGVRFNAKMKGELHVLQKMFAESDSYIGKKLTVKYQGLTKTGVPRFPVGVRFRTDF